MASRRISVFVKRQNRFGKLSYNQQQMYRLGVFGVAEVLNRIGKAKSIEDGPAKPLGRGYAIKKTKLGLGNRRNLKFTGDMLRNLSVRTVSKDYAEARLTSKKQRDKGLANTKIEEWLSFSPSNQRRVAEVGRDILIREKIPFMILERALGQ
jgi:hypothetical protein